MLIIAGSETGSGGRSDLSDLIARRQLNTIDVKFSPWPNAFFSLSLSHEPSGLRFTIWELVV